MAKEIEAYVTTSHKVYVSVAARRPILKQFPKEEKKKKKLLQSEKKCNTYCKCSPRRKIYSKHMMYCKCSHQ
jgi:hypothetical protein